jgi:hypothetical protein
MTTTTIKGDWVIAATSAERARTLHKSARDAGLDVKTGVDDKTSYFLVHGDLAAAQSIVSEKEGDSIMANEPQHGVG